MASTALALKGMGIPNSMGKLREKYVNLRGRVSRMNDKAGEKIEGVVKTLEIQAAAFVFGAIQGAWFEARTDVKADDKPGAHWFGVPVEIFVGLGGLGAGLFGFGGEKWSGHLINFANGALAAASANYGRSWGYKFRKDQLAKKSKTASSSGNSLREEIASLLDE